MDSKMAGFNLYRSNRMEQLTGKLADVLRVPLDSPFAAETVIVQSLGMGKWLSLELASRHGICANCKFPFPKKFVDDIFAAVFPGLKSASRNDFFSPQTMTWRLMKVLPEFGSNPAFAAVHNYISGQNPNLKLFQLAERIAYLFDQYIVFRPNLILDWERGRDEGDWQAILWRELVKNRAENHQAALGQKLSDLLKNETFSDGQFPGRISIFGISSLPPFYVRLFGALSEHMEIHFFLLDPTDQYWGDIISDSEEDFIRRKMKNPLLTAGDLHADEKNSLLASLGKTGRDFQDLVLEIASGETCELFVPPGESTLLAALQNDIFLLQDPSEKRTISPDDHSVQIHSCHSPMREMEILHDQLLAMFEQDSSLAPKDVVVMMPDVKIYAPYIEAVFGAPEDFGRQIPFTIADRGFRAENGLADAFLRILETTRGRFGAGTVLAILESSAVQRRFQLTEADLETIRVWLDKAGIRWGIDADHRARLGLPALDQNTWRAGLRRLLLGWALPGKNEHLFGDILPYDEIEGGLAQTLGTFVEFAESLFALAAEIETPRSLHGWQSLFFGILNNFFSDDENSALELRSLRQILSSLSDTAQNSEFDGLVAPEVMLAFLKRLLDSHETSTGFMNGQVTFCAFRPMRSVPFKVVCLAGMNDGSFPRPDAALGFDKMAAAPQRGDRSNRHEDRHLFLEAILSARNTLYISYVGQSIRDNSALTPSVLVSELLDCLDRGFAVSGKNLNDHLITTHKLQAFSADYFSGNRLFSYSGANCAASKIASAGRKTPELFFETELSEPENEFQIVDLDSLAQFFCNPSEFLLRNRLGIYLREPDSLLNERETFEVNGLTGFGARDFLAKKRMAGAPEERLLDVLRADGQLPPGFIGDCHSRSFAAEVESFIKILSGYTTSPVLPDVSFETQVGPHQLTGSIRGIYPAHLLRQRCAKMKPKDILRAWLHHLAANLFEPNRVSVLVCLDHVVTFQPVQNSREILETLLSLYRDGLRKPLRFFPASSYAYAQRQFRPSERQKKSAREMGEEKWFGSDYADEATGESADPYIQTCFRGVENPLDEEWEAISSAVFKPILDHSIEEKL